MTNHPALRRAWLSFGCYCTRYFAEDQTLLGTLTLTSPVGAAALSGTVDLTTDGAVPFYQGGFAPPQHGVVHATFSVTPPPSH